MFMLCDSLDLAAAQIPKSGVTSVNRWLRGVGRAVSNDEAMKASRRVAFIRHPMERLKSCYSMMHYQKEQGEPHWSGAPTDSWPEFVDYILTHDNAHWNPQVSIVGDVPNTYHRLENVAQHCQKYVPGGFPHANRSKRVSVEPYRTEELAALYRDDMALWARIN